MSTTENASKRVLHVPLTDAEFRALKIAALDGKTMGELVADALRKTYNLGAK